MHRPLAAAASPPGTPAATRPPIVAPPVAGGARAGELPRERLLRHRLAIGHVTDMGAPAPSVVRRRAKRIHRRHGHAGEPRRRAAVAPVHALEMN